MAQEQTIFLPFDTYELFTVDPPFNLNATVDSNLPLFYESQNNRVLNVDSDGNVQIINFGKTLVKIFNRGNFSWAPVEKFVLIDVKRKKQSINFFLIPNKYLGEANFSLSSYAFSSSGLPIKYRSLNPNIANIGEKGDVLMYNVGTAQFEAYQEGNFEWEDVKVINEFGISHRHYPFGLSLTSNNTNTLIRFSLYQNNNNQLENIGRISGGLYFGDSKYPLNTGLFLLTGEYIGVINYEPISSGEAVSILNTFYSFSTGIYSGNKQNKFLSFIINRSGFLDYGIDVIIQGVFNEDYGYKYASQLALESGIFWSGSFPPTQQELLFTLPLFYNNKTESDTAGKLKFTFINKTGIPESLIQIGEFEEADFIISSGSSTIGETGILPYFPKNLGSDFLNFKQATLKPEEYPK